MDRLNIQRFGPINEGEIDISPLTVLIGPNSSGKSYAAMVLHSLYKNTDVDMRRLWNQSDSENIFPDNELEKFQKIQSSWENGNEVRIDTPLLNSLLKYVYEELSSKLERNITSTFSTEPSDLITKGHRKTRFDLYNELGRSEISYWSEDENIQTREYPESSYHARVVPIDDESEEEPGIKRNNENKEIVFKVQRETSSQLNLITILIYMMYDLVDVPLQTDSHYLPAARSGLLESHEVISAGAVDMVSQAGIEPIELPAFSGEVSDYLKTISNMTNKDEGELSHVADEFEEDLLNGNIVVEQKDERPSPQVNFQQDGHEYPLHLISTGISETAPLILYTRYILSQGSTLVIEEPEAHLHPENQLKVAHFIVKLSNAGVRVIVTTHSDFFLQHLSYSIVASQIDDQIKEDSELSDIPQIEPEKVSVHTFESVDSDSGDSNEFGISELEIDETDGIPLEEFERVTDNLYGISLKMDRLLEKSWEVNE